MKITLKVVCYGKRRTFEVAIGNGDKTFKWLGNVASQMYSNSQPNGKLRSRDDYRGATVHMQHSVHELELPNREVPHPMSLISDYIMDGDMIKVVLVSKLPIGSAGESLASTYSLLSNVNSTSNPHYIDDSEYIEDETDAIFGGNMFGDNGLADDSRVQSAANISTLSKMDKTKHMKEAHVRYMRRVLNSQLLNSDFVNKELNLAWKQDVTRLMPRLKPNDSEDLKSLFTIHFGMITSLYGKYTKDKPGEMSRLNLKDMMAASKMFPREEEFEEITTRIFRLVSKGDSFIKFGQFLTALILLAQSKHHNVMDAHNNVFGAHGSLKAILEMNLTPLANQHRMRIRDILYGEDVMSGIYDNFEDLFKLFEKYAAKAGRDLTTSMPIELFGQLIVDADIVAVFTEEEEERPIMIRNIAEEILNNCQAGFINGRTEIPHDLASENDLPPPPTEDFSFPEFIEGIARATYFMLDEEDRIMFEEDHILDGFSKALTMLVEKEEEVVETKKRGRK